MHLLGRQVSDGSLLAISVVKRSGAVKWLQGLLIQADVDLGDNGELVVLAVDALDLGIMAKALLDGRMDGAHCVGLALRGHDLRISQVFVEMDLLEGFQGRLEVAQLVLHEGRFNRTGAVLLVLVACKENGEIG